MEREETNSNKPADTFLRSQQNSAADETEAGGFAALQSASGI